MMLQDLLQDLRVTLRGLLRAPMMTLTIVVTVGLGIGATTVIFSAIHAALLRPLPYADPGRLVRIYTDTPPNRFRFSVADYQALQAEQTHFEQIAGYTDRLMSFSDGNVAERLRGKLVSSTYFSLLGVYPATGRDFAEADSRPGNPLVVIVSRGFWHQRLAGRLDAIGKTIRIDGADHVVVGVLPQAVGPLEEGQDLFIAAQWQPPRRKGPFLITTLARLRSESERSAAADELRARRCRPGVADRLRQRVEPARRAGDEPAARARGPRRAGRVARSRRAISDGGKRGARDRRRVVGDPPGADGSAPAS
jgi:putative ABC transport system permease protein